MCYKPNDTESSCKREDCIHCIPPFKLYCFESISRNAELRNKWIIALHRQNWEGTIWKWQALLHTFGGAYEANFVPTLNLGYEVEEKKATRTLIRQPLPKKIKIKENNDVGYEDDVVFLPISTNVTDSQPTVTCSTPHTWSAIL